MGRIRRGAATALLVITVLALGGCTGGDGGTAGGGSGSTPAEDVAPAEPAELRDGGEFRWPLDRLPEQYNLHHADGTATGTAAVVRAVMPTPFRADARGVLQPDPDYLVSAEVVRTDPQVVELVLSPEFRWNDGRAADWTDVEAQWAALRGTDAAYRTAPARGFDAIAGVAPGATPQHAVITFAERFADWRALWTVLYPRETNRDPAVFDGGWRGAPIAAAGAGPFVLDAVDPAAQRLTVVRNPRWWGDRPVLERIVFVGIDPARQAEAFAAGELSAVDIGSDTSRLDRVRQVPDTVVRRAAGPGYRHLTFRGAAGSVLADPALRRAVMKGVDRAAIVRTLLGGVAPAEEPLGNHLYARDLDGYRDNSASAAFDPAAAGAELDALGWALAGDVRVRDGVPLVLRDVVPAGVIASTAEAALVRQQLGAIGVRVEVVEVPADRFFAQYVGIGDFDITHFSWPTPPTPISVLDPVFRTGSGIGQNYGGIGSEAINQLLDRATAELDPAAQRELGDQLDRELWAVGHSLPLYQRPEVVAVRSDVRNFGATGLADDDYARIGFAGL